MAVFKKCCYPDSYPSKKSAAATCGNQFSVFVDGRSTQPDLLLRVGSTVARFGGDEFVVVISELDVDKAESITQASIVAEKIRATLAEPYVFKIQHEGKAETTIEHHCTSSVGVVLFNHEASREDILKWADIVMYQAKEAGRNLIRFYEPKA